MRVSNNTNKTEQKKQNNNVQIANKKIIKQVAGGVGA